MAAEALRGRGRAPARPVGLRHMDLRLATAGDAAPLAPAARRAPVAPVAPRPAGAPQPPRRSRSAGVARRLSAPSRGRSRGRTRRLDALTPESGSAAESGSPRRRPPDDPRYRRRSVEAGPVRCHDGAQRIRQASRIGAKRTDRQRRAVPHSEGGADGQRFHEGLEVPDGAVLVEGRRVRRPEGADPAGHRGRPAAAPGAVPAGGGGDRQPAPAGDEAQPAARRGREAAGLGPPGAGARRPGPRRGRRGQGRSSTSSPRRRSPRSWSPPSSPSRTSRRCTTSRSRPRGRPSRPSSATR